MKLTPISDAETRVMEVLWRTSPLAAEDVAAKLETSEGWQLATVKTLLNRLLKKGAISAEREGRRYLYSPLLARADWAQSESLSLLDRLFGGSIAPLVSHFSSRRKLKPADLAALKALIADYENSEKKGKKNG